MSKIIEIIKDATFKTDEKGWGEYDGFIIKTEDDEIKIGISNSQDCCEEWGYLSSEDNLNDFIGANILSIDVTDKALRKYEDLEYLDDGEAMFIDINTDKGKLQLVTYNSHNGYYGHEAVLITKDKDVSEIL